MLDRNNILVFNYHVYLYKLHKKYNVLYLLFNIWEYRQGLYKWMDG